MDEHVIRIDHKMFLALTEAKQAIQILSQKTDKYVDKHVFVSTELEATWNFQFSTFPSKLSHIPCFCKLALQIKSNGNCMVLCTGNDPDRIRSCVHLLGSYLILCEDYTLDQAMTMLRSADRFFRDQEATIPSLSINLSNRDCWHAIHLAKQQGWINFLRNEGEVDPDQSIDLDEYQHYDNLANGDLHVIVPSKLIAIRPPRDISTDPHTGAARTWADDDYGRRSFSPAYYADVLSDFDVKLVLCYGQPSYDAAPFLNHGIAVEEMPDASTDAAPASLLRRIDRFLTLAQLAPGAIAIHCDEYGLGPAEVLVSTYLVRRCGFPSSAALAWARMVHPESHVPALRYTSHLVLPPADADSRNEDATEHTASLPLPQKQRQQQQQVQLEVDVKGENAAADAGGELSPRPVRTAAEDPGHGDARAPDVFGLALNAPPAGAVTVARAAV
jgi:hypothetical protein